MKKPNQYYKNPYNGVEVELKYDEVKGDWNIVLAKPPKPTDTIPVHIWKEVEELWKHGQV